jgi:ribosome-associated protein
MRIRALKSPALARAIARLTQTKKADEVVIMDLRGLTTMTDFFVVCSADSDVQIRAIADAVEQGLEPRGVAAWHKESGSPNWVLLDYVDVVLHVFHKNTRAFYNLERLWGDATMTTLVDRGDRRRTRAVRPAGKARTAVPRRSTSRAV